MNKISPASYALRVVVNLIKRKIKFLKRKKC